MLKIVSVGLSIVSMVCCIYCVIRLKDVKADRDKCLTWFLECHADCTNAVDKWGETIELCKKLNNDIGVIDRYNQQLIDINADLRLEFYKLKENKNA